MSRSVHGFVTHVSGYMDGNVEIEFFDFEKSKIVTFSNVKEGLPKDIVDALADSLARNIWVKIDYENAKASCVSFEEYNFQKDIYKLKEKLEKVWNGYLERA